MQAVVYDRYGPPDVLRKKQVPTPTPGAGEVLLKLRATSVNASDWEVLTGKPFYARMYGLTKPRRPILGSDFAGVVAAVGDGVTALQPGAEVFGNLMQSLGGFAEYVCAPAKDLARKPAGISFAQAATLPQAATVALQAVRDKGRIESGDKVLINGAGGGVGTFAVQIAKTLGAEVIGVDAADKLERIRAIGADRTIDYAVEDFTETLRDLDLILDVVGNRSVFDLKRPLRADGVYAVVGGHIIHALVMGTWVSLTSKRQMGVFAWRPNTRDLEYVGELCQAGTIAPMIDRCYSLGEAPAALSRLGNRQTLGMGVISFPA